MTKKDYERIAGDILVQLNTIHADLRCAKNPPAGVADSAVQVRFEYAAQNLRQLAEALASTFRVDNERFDRARFLAACGF